MEKIVAIVGKPNVGKSTLFNKLVGHRSSIVHDEPGVTRDRLYGEIEWLGKKIKIIDTGGIEISDGNFQKEITFQSKIAIEESSVIIFMIDGREEVTSSDHYIMSILRKSGKPIIILVNKLEGNKEFDSSIWTLGVENIFPISASHGEGIGNALDKIITYFDFSKEEEINKLFKLSIIGRPNVGKSSLLNILSSKKRSIVSEIAGTTRDSVDSIINIEGEYIRVIDTAGISKKSKILELVEHFALIKAKNSLDSSELTLLIIDATRELSHFDARIAGYAMESIMPIIIVVNKWDLIKKTTMTMKEFEKKIRKEFKFMSWAPIVFISAKNGERINKLKETIIKVKQNLKKQIKTSILNEIVTDIQIMQPAPNKNGGRLTISFIRQINSRVPSFLLFVNNKKYLHFSYQRYIENQFREYLGFEGTPIRLIFKNKKGDKNNE